jgi:hypothetical protein
MYEQHIILVFFSQKWFGIMTYPENLETYFHDLISNIDFSLLYVLLYHQYQVLSCII